MTPPYPKSLVIWAPRGPVTGILVLKIMVRGTKIFNLLAENFGPGPKFSIDNPEKNGPPLKILVRGGRIRFNFLCCVTATNKQSGIIEIEVVGHKLQQCKGVGACAATGDRESSGVIGNPLRVKSPPPEVTV